MIVHAGGRVGDKTTKQLSKIIPRTFRPVLNSGEQLSFSLLEINALKSDMLNFIESLAGE